MEPPADSKLSSAEVFGPVTCLYSYSDRHQAIELANKPDTFFQAAVFTQDLDIALDTFKRLRGMAVMVNAARANFGGDLELALHDLPAGVTAEPVTMAAKRFE